MPWQRSEWSKWHQGASVQNWIIPWSPLQSRESWCKVSAPSSNIFEWMNHGNMIIRQQRFWPMLNLSHHTICGFKTFDLIQTVGTSSVDKGRSETQVQSLHIHKFVSKIKLWSKQSGSSLTVKRDRAWKDKVRNMWRGAGTQFEPILDQRIFSNLQTPLQKMRKKHPC